MEESSTSENKSLDPQESFDKGQFNQLVEEYTAADFSRLDVMKNFFNSKFLLRQSLLDDDSYPKAARLLTQIFHGRYATILDIAEPTDFVRDFVNNNLDVINKRMENPENDEATIDLLHLMTIPFRRFISIPESDESDKTDERLDIISRSVLKVIPIVQNKRQGFDELLFASEQIMSSDNLRTKLFEEQLFSSLFDSSYDGNRLAGEIVEYLYSSTNESVSSQIKEKVLSPFLSRFKLNPGEIFSAWDLGSVHHIRKQLILIHSLESKKAGIVSTLANEFGIRNFARYPEEVLMDLYDKKDNEDAKFGVLIFPRADYNEAFLDLTDILRGFNSELKNLGYEMRIYEAGSKSGLARSLLSAKRRYSQKISFAVIAGHGEPSLIVFGDVKRSSDGKVAIDDITKQNLLTLEDIQGPGAKKIGNLLTDDASITLLSCSTGAEEGLASKIYETYPGLTVTAPDKDASIQGLHATTDEAGLLKISVEYGLGANSKVFSSQNNKSS